MLQKALIYLQGRPESHWADGLGGDNITEARQTERGFKTILVGRLQGQAQITVLLISLYELHLPVVSMQGLESRSLGV